METWAGQAALAYQLQDDLEDLVSDSEKGQGRGIATDLLHCKPTYLYATAKTLATGLDREALLRWQAGEKSGLDTSDIIAILERAGAAQACRREVARLVELAFSALAGAEPSLSPGTVREMREFVSYFVSTAYWRRPIAGGAGRASALLA